MVVVMEGVAVVVEEVESGIVEAVSSRTASGEKRICFMVALFRLRPRGLPNRGQRMKV